MTPQPPVGMSVNQVAEQWALGIMAVLVVISFLFAAYHWKQSGRPIVMLLFMAGGCMMIMEPLVDAVAACWFPRDSEILFTGWGRPIPLWVCLTYFVYFGLGTAITWIMLDNGITYKQIWLVYIIEMAAEFILETVMLEAGTFTYYGFQPLLVGKFPLWWASVNSLISIVAAYLTVILARSLSGWSLLLIIPAMLSTGAAVNAAAGWPSWFVINTDVGPIFTQIGGLASIAIAFSIVHIIAKNVSIERSDNNTQPNLAPA